MAVVVPRIDRSPIGINVRLTGVLVLVVTDTSVRPVNNIIPWLQYQLMRAMRAGLAPRIGMKVLR